MGYPHLPFLLPQLPFLESWAHRISPPIWPQHCVHALYLLWHGCWYSCKKSRHNYPLYLKRAYGLSFYPALPLGYPGFAITMRCKMEKASIVAPIDKLSILFSILFARIWLGERLSKKALLGLGILTAGTLLLLVKF